MKLIYWFLILVLIPVVYSADDDQVEVEVEVEVEENAYVILEDDPSITLTDFESEGINEFASLVASQDCLKPHFQRLTEYLTKTTEYNVQLSSKINDFSKESSSKIDLSCHKVTASNNSDYLQKLLQTLLNP